jgi:hypothetical protein
LKGRPIKALKLLLKDSDNPALLRRAKDDLLYHLWHNLSFGITLNADTSDPIVHELLALARQLDVTMLEEAEGREVSSMIFVLNC